MYVETDQLTLVQIRPKFKFMDKLAVDLECSVTERRSKPNDRDRQPGKLTFECADFPPMLKPSNPLHECRKAALDLDCRAVLSQRFSIGCARIRRGFAPQVAPIRLCEGS
jgi:hypothetical protein